MIAAMREAHNAIGVDYSNTMHQAQNVRITQFFDGERARAALGNQVIGLSGQDLISVAASKEEEAKQQASKYQSVRHQLVVLYNKWNNQEHEEDPEAAASTNEVAVMKLYLGCALSDMDVEAFLSAKSSRTLRSKITLINPKDAWFQFVDVMKGTDTAVGELLPSLHGLQLTSSRLDSVEDIYGPHLDALLTAADFPLISAPTTWPPAIK